MIPVWLINRLDQPEYWIHTSTRFLKKGHKYCYVRVVSNNKTEKIRKGAYALVNITAKPNSGDRVLILEPGGSLSLMRMYKENAYYVAKPFKGSKLHTYILNNRETIAGKIERIFNMP